MTDLSKIATADLILELGARCERAEKLFALLGNSTYGKIPVREMDVRSAYPKGKRRAYTRELSPELVLSHMGKFNDYVSSSVVHKTLGHGTIAATQGHLGRLHAAQKLLRRGTRGKYEYKLP